MVRPAGADRRGGGDRDDLLARQSWRGGVPLRIPASVVHRPGATVDRGGHGDRAGGSDRDRVDDLLLSVGPGSPLRHAGLRQPRPRRLEHRHHRRTGGRGEFRRTARIHRAKSAMRVPTSSWRSSWRCGTHGRTTRSSATRRPACGQIRPSCTRPVLTAAGFTLPPTCPFPGRRKATPSWPRRAPPGRGSRWRPSMPTASSPL